MTVRPGGRAANLNWNSEGACSVTAPRFGVRPVGGDMPAHRTPAHLAVYRRHRDGLRDRTDIHCGLTSRLQADVGVSLFVRSSRRADTELNMWRHTHAPGNCDDADLR